MKGSDACLEDLDFQQFIRKVKHQTGIDFSLYKEKQMKRRLTTLRMKRGCNTFQEFYKKMMENREWFEEFLDRITINVSEFWRNPNRWEALKDVFIPEMIRHSKRLKCWSAACSTGEEPYTLAMILAEAGVLGTSSITASDIDRNALEKARQGIYMERSVRDVPSYFLHKYFVKEDALFKVKDEIKRAVRFEQMNLLADPFDDGFDLIICRNVMIYFTDDAKHLLYEKFSRSLKPGGLLFVGSTEQIFSPERYGFETADTFFYRKMA